MTDRERQERFNRVCQQLEQAILDAELEFLKGCSAEDQREFSAALPIVHTALQLRYLASAAAPGVDIAAAATALVDLCLRENGAEIFEIAREAKRKPH